MQQQLEILYAFADELGYKYSYRQEVFLTKVPHNNVHYRIMFNTMVKFYNTNFLNQFDKGIAAKGREKWWDLYGLTDYRMQRALLVKRWDTLQLVMHKKTKKIKLISER